jgi:hypothetical protein
VSPLIHTYSVINDDNGGDEINQFTGFEDPQVPGDISASTAINPIKFKSVVRFGNDLSVPIGWRPKYFSVA